MIAAQVVVKDGLTEPLERFGARAPKMLDSILRMSGYRYRAYVQRNYLSGGMLNRDTGGLYKSITVGKKKGTRHVFWIGPAGTTDRVHKNPSGWTIYKLNYWTIAAIFEHEGGYVIRQKRERADGKKKLLVVPTANGVFFKKEVVGKQRPFMTASSASFNFDEAFDKSSEAVIKKELKRLGLGVSA